MGMSSSQARLLNLTARMHQIEYKAAKLEAQKLQMANESRRVYEEYLDSLEATKIQFKTINNKGSLTNIDATYNKLVAMGYVLKMDGDDAEIVTPAIIDNYRKATDNETSFGQNNKDYFAALQTGRVDSNLMNGSVLEIYTAGQLAAALATNPTGASCRLMGDIDMTGLAYNSADITNCQIDGNGHSITGLDKALFNNVRGNSSISNLTISGSTEVSKGLLANAVNTTGTISNVKASGTIQSTRATVGGLIGLVKHGTIEYCTSSVDVTSESQAGGLVGQVLGNSTTDKVIIRECSATGDVCADNQISGGLIGQCTNADISNCASSGDVRSKYIGEVGHKATYAVVGGFIGYICGTRSGGTYQLGNTTINNCSTSSDVYSSTAGAGGFVGFAADKGGSEITNCSASGEIHYNCAASTQEGVEQLELFRDASEEWILGGFAGKIAYAQINNCDSTSTMINEWSEDINTTEQGAFVGNVMEAQVQGNNNYSNNTDLNFVGLNKSTETFDGVSIAAPNNSPVIPASAPALTQIKVNNSGADAARDLFNRMHENGYKLLAEDDPRLTHGDDPVWLRNMINEGMIYLFKPNSDNELYETSVSIDTNLQEVPDETLLRKAEAKYEADMRKIDRKDRMYDHELAALDNERNAIKSEMETLKTVAKDNVERTFKLFS
ncbi:MAG: hypothetical protein K6E29_01735 [Cyanobacteria bacterium RUI128]|nr:hypothetical protein [Cyanobacteria bacterium RUI128]